MKKTLFLVFMVLCCSFVAAPAAAADFPQPADAYISDYAQILKPVDEKSIRELLQEFRSQTGVEMTVVTVDSIYDYAAPDETLESFSTALFNHWGIGKKETNDGVLVLFAYKDRKVRIELGSGYDSRHDAMMRRVIDDRMLPYFRDGDYSRGLYEGTRAVVERLSDRASVDASAPEREAIPKNYGGVQGSSSSFSLPFWLIVVVVVLCILAGISCMRNGKKGWGWVFFAAAGMLIVLILRLLFRGGRGGGFGGGRSSGGGASGSW